MGGVKTDIWGRTVVPGLYAAGEVPCVSVHAGHRLGAHLLPDTPIFGRRSGEHAAETAATMARVSIPQARLDDEQRWIDSFIASDRGGRRTVGIKQEPGRTL